MENLPATQIKVKNTIRHKIKPLVGDDNSKLVAEVVSVAEGRLMLVNAGSEACGNFWLNLDCETYAIHSTDEGDRQYEALIKPIFISEKEKIMSGDWFYYNGKSFNDDNSKEWPAGIYQALDNIEEKMSVVGGLGFRFKSDKNWYVKIGYNVPYSSCTKILALPEHFAITHLQEFVAGTLKDGDIGLLETCDGLDPASSGSATTIIKTNPFITIHKP